MVSTYIAVAALTVSCLSFVLNYRIAAGSDRRARIPVLVFVYQPGQGWFLQNVGNGPALNVVVAESDRYDNWLKPVRIPPLGKDKEIRLPWVEGGYKLGATYEDFLKADTGRPRVFTVICSFDLNETSTGSRLRQWKDDEVGTNWELSEPSRQRRGKSPLRAIRSIWATRDADSP